MMTKATNESVPQPQEIELIEQREPHSAADMPMTLSSEEIHKLVAEAAYYRAEQRGFVPGYDVDDWLSAEAQIMERLGVKPN